MKFLSLFSISTVENSKSKAGRNNFGLLYNEQPTSFHMNSI